MLLLRRPGLVVTREELRNALWPADTFVEFDQGLNTAIKKIRLALGDSADNPRFIETLPRKGYRFIAPVGERETPAPISVSATPSDSVIIAGVIKRHKKAAIGSVAVAAALVALMGRQRPPVAYALAALALTGLLVGGLVLYRARKAPVAPSTEWVQLTDFADSATQPALSPDGRMLAFLRGPGTFMTPGQVYIKMLPSGEPVPLTHDNTVKMSPTFSPDGSQLAYTVGHGWDSWVVPVLGGQSKLLLPNASGLTWVDNRRLLFSEIKRGRHMAVVTATESRAEARDIYVPTDETGMAHRSYLSPDHRWVLLAEMDAGKPDWLPCRLVPFDGSSSGRAVGPQRAACTSAAWSPDGRWMYFSANAGGGSHVWRQRFPDGLPQQITSGPTPLRRAA